MCQECGCGLGAPHAVREDEDSGIDNARLERLVATPHHGPVGPGHSHEPETGLGTPPGLRRHLEIQQSLLDQNQRLAERNRGLFQAKRLLVLNMVSAPGSGKTALIERTGHLLRPHLRLGAIVGDLETDNDARRLRSAGLPVVPIATGTLCHLEAGMVHQALGQLDLDQLDILVIENVGNLVCPAAFDLGEHLRVVLTSVTEGEDKPLKYPPLFHSAHVALITKMDLADAVGFDRPAALGNLGRISHHARQFEVSARTGEGMDAWVDFLTQQLKAVRH